PAVRDGNSKRDPDRRAITATAGDSSFEAFIDYLIESQRPTRQPLSPQWLEIWNLLPTVYTMVLEEDAAARAAYHRKIVEWFEAGAAEPRPTDRPPNRTAEFLEGITQILGYDVEVTESSQFRFFHGGKERRLSDGEAQILL